MANFNVRKQVLKLVLLMQSLTQQLLKVEMAIFGG